METQVWSGNGGQVSISYHSKSLFYHPFPGQRFLPVPLKLQQYIRYKAAWEGVETLNIIPRNTSALCCVCRHTLYGNYTYRTCPNCIVRVDRDVNAVWNVWRTTAAARYGLKVRPSREEAQRTPDVILCPGVLVRGGRSLRVDREFDTGDV